MLGLPFGLWWGFQSSLVLAVQFSTHLEHRSKKFAALAQKSHLFQKTKAENVFSVFGFCFFIFKATLTKKFWGLLLLTFGNAK